MELIIRREYSKDIKFVSEIIEDAFKNEEYSDQKEHLLVDALRKSSAFIPELSLVAEYKNKLVGHVLLTKIIIKNTTETFESLALAPVSVTPEFQHKGIGTSLILESHKNAKKLGYNSIVLIGHENYYPKFGYELTSKYNITLPFEAPEKNCMVISLTDSGLQNVRGHVEYPKEFYEL